MKQKNNILKKIVNKFRSKDSLNEWYKLADFLGIDRNLDKDARSEATYFACLKILSESIGKLPFKLMQRTPRKGITEARKHPLYNIVRYRPNRFMTSTTFWSTNEYFRNHYGNSVSLIVGSGKNLQLYPLDYSCIQIWYDNAAILKDVPDIYYIYNFAGKRYIFKSEEVVHFKSSISEDGIEGLSVRSVLKSTIKGNQTAQALQNSLYESGFTAKAAVQYTGDLNDKNVQSFLENIENYAKGKIQAAKGIIPIPIGSQLIPLNSKLGDNEFLELKKYSALQIAAAFGIKPVQINDYSKSSYSSSESQNLAFLVDTLLFILKQYEEELNYKLLSPMEIANGYFFKFNIAMLLRADLKTQIESLSKGVSNFLYTPNEARSHLDLEAKDGGDELIGNGSTIKLTQVGIQYGTKEKQILNNLKGGDEK